MCAVFPQEILMSVYIITEVLNPYECIHYYWGIIFNLWLPFNNKLII